MSKLIDVDKIPVDVMEVSPDSGDIIIGVWEYDGSTLRLLAVEDGYVSSNGDMYKEDDIAPMKILGKCVFSIYG